MAQRRERDIFISATSQGFKSYRSLARDIVSAQGYTAVVQEHFDTPHDQLIHKIREAISRCDGVIAIVGPYYGMQTPIILDGKPLSYTQFELLYALEACGKPCVIFLTSKAFRAAADKGGNSSQEFADCEEWQRAFMDKVHGFKNCGLATFGDAFEFVLAFAKLRWKEWLNV